jgi:ABC-type transport system substrate-binding protein
MTKRTWVWVTSLCLALGATALAATPSESRPPEKVLRYAFPVAETGMDPAQLSDLYSRILTANIFDALYGYDYLARPVQVTPVLADGMPQASADFRTFTVRLRHGIYFADDPVFGGKKRELTAQDVVYTYKRIFDPKVKSPSLSDLEDQTLLGLDALRKQAQTSGKFDYDRSIEGLQAVDRYTVQFRLAQSRPRFIYTLADPGIYGIVAREVVEKYGDQIMEHPVGTGPFMLQEWERSSKLTFVRNPNYRPEFYDATPAADDASGRDLAARMKGKRLPLVDKVVVSIIDEPQPRWLSFLNNEQDLVQGLPASFATYAIPNNQLAPNLAKRGIKMERVALSDIALMYFNMEDPLVGGYTPEKVALRRAIGLGYNSDEEVRLPRHGQAIVAQGLIGVRPRLPLGNGHLRPRPGDRPAGHVWLHRQGRRRLARSARWQAAGAGNAHAGQLRLPGAGRNPQEEHGRPGHQDGVQDRQMARAAEGGASRQADDVAAGV